MPCAASPYTLSDSDSRYAVPKVPIEMTLLKMEMKHDDHVHTRQNMYV